MIHPRWFLQCDVRPSHNIAKRLYFGVTDAGALVPFPDDLQAYLRPEIVGIVLRAKRGVFANNRAFSPRLFKMGPLYAVVHTVLNETRNKPADYVTHWYLLPDRGLWLPVAPDDPLVETTVDHYYLKRIGKVLAS